MDLPTREDYFAQLEAEKCPVCYDPLTNATKTSCNHYFCLDCLKTWLTSSNTCPACRTELLQPSAPQDAYTFGDITFDVEFQAQVQAQYLVGEPQGLGSSYNVAFDVESPAQVQTQYLGDEDAGSDRAHLDLATALDISRGVRTRMQTGLEVANEEHAREREVARRLGFSLSVYGAEDRATTNLPSSAAHDVNRSSPDPALRSNSPQEPAEEQAGQGHAAPQHPQDRAPGHEEREVAMGETDEAMLRPAPVPSYEEFERTPLISNAATPAIPDFEDSNINPPSYSFSAGGSVEEEASEETLSQAVLRTTY